MLKKCLNCNKKLINRQSKFCSPKCKWENQIGKSHSITHRKKISKALKGKLRGKMKPEHKKNWELSFKNRIKNRHYEIFNEYAKKWNQLPDIFWAWVSGFWEGEGSLVYRKLKTKIDGRITITQKDKTPLIYIQKILQTGKIYKFRNKPYICHFFRLSKHPTSHLFAFKILPYIKGRRRKNQVLAYLKRTNNFYEEHRKNKEIQTC